MSATNERMRLSRVCPSTDTLAVFAITEEREIVRRSQRFEPSRAKRQPVRPLVTIGPRHHETRVPSEHGRLLLDDQWLCLLLAFSQRDQQRRWLERFEERIVVEIRLTNLSQGHQVVGTGGQV